MIAFFSQFSIDKTIIENTLMTPSIHSRLGICVESPPIRNCCDKINYFCKRDILDLKYLQ